MSGNGLLSSLKEDLRHVRVKLWKYYDILRPGTRYAVWDPGDPGPFLGRRVGDTHGGAHR